MILRDNLDVMLNNKYEYVKKLNIMDDEKIKMYRCKNGDICFLGTFKEYPKWKNLFTDEYIGDSVNAKYSVKDNGKNAFRSEFVTDVQVNDNCVYLFDASEIKINDKPIQIAVQCIDKQYTDIFKTMVSDNCIEVNVDKFPEMSRCMLMNRQGMNSIYLDYFKAGLQVGDKNIRANLSGCTGFAYSPKESLIVTNLQTYKYKNDNLQLLNCTVKSEDDGAFADISHTVTVLDPQGYIYIEPFVVGEQMKDAKLLVIGSKEFQVECYDNNSNEWTELRISSIFNAKDEVKLRVKAKFYDRIKEVVLVK